MRQKPVQYTGLKTRRVLPPKFFHCGPCADRAKAFPGCIWRHAQSDNLGDITLRALETLAGVDLIACEDTQDQPRLTERYAISAQLTHITSTTQPPRGQKSWSGWRRVHRSRGIPMPARP